MSLEKVKIYKAVEEESGSTSVWKDKLISLISKGLVENENENEITKTKAFAEKLIETLNSQD